MKAEILVTIRLTPESRQEMISTYPADYRALRANLEQQIEDADVLQLPGKATKIRWILNSGRWE